MENERKFLILRGLSAAGKSTFAKSFLEENPNFVEVNRDNIRLALFGRERMWSGDENKVSEVEEQQIKDAFASGKSVISSNTNLNDRYIAKFRKLADLFKAVVEINDSFLSVPLEELLRRDSIREHPVSASVIHRQYNKYVRKDTHYREPYLKPQDTSLPQAVIFDQDGTLTTGPKNRSPYDMSKISQDEPNPYALNMLEMFSSNPQMQIFIFSGREEKARLNTMEWLFKHTEVFRHAVFDGRVEMFMREDGNSEGDDKLKERLYTLHVKDKFHVVAVFDDRLKVVVNVWGPRGFGLPLFRVGDPEANF